MVNLVRRIHANVPGLATPLAAQTTTSGVIQVRQEERGHAGKVASNDCRDYQAWDERLVARGSLWL